MKTTPPPRIIQAGFSRQLAKVRERLLATDDLLRAIRRGDVDTVTIAGKGGPQVFTLEGAGHAYRVLIESMNEGALTLTAKGIILYANLCFARMVVEPLEHVIGSSFLRLISAADRLKLRPLLIRKAKRGAKIPVLLHAGGGPMPVQISIRSLAKQGFKHAAIGMVVTDLTEARQNEERLRALTHRVVQVQETERGRLALELHDNITQLICGVLFRSQALVDKIPAGNEPAKKEAVKLRELLGQTASEVERISHNLRPTILEHLGLSAALRATCAEFAGRTGLTVKVTCEALTAPLPPDTELALYRILQVALRNVEQHAQAKRVTVALSESSNFVELLIKDNGIGFDARTHSRMPGGKGLGLLGMHERANHVGGAFKLKSVRHLGTEIEVRMPLPAVA